MASPFFYTGKKGTAMNEVKVVHKKLRNNYTFFQIFEALKNFEL